MTRLLRPIALLTALSTASCAAILYPERKGNRGGAIDLVPLVVDILLFIPGLIPGIIAIIVDFGTGAIYTGKGTAKTPDVGRRGKIALGPKGLPEGTTVRLALLDADGRVLDHDEGDASRRRVSVDLREAARAHADERDVPLTLQMQIGERPPVTQALVMR